MCSRRSHQWSCLTSLHLSTVPLSVMPWHNIHLKQTACKIHENLIQYLLFTFSAFNLRPPALFLEVPRDLSPLMQRFQCDFKDTCKVENKRKWIVLIWHLGQNDADSCAPWIILLAVVQWYDKFSLKMTGNSEVEHSLSEKSNSSIQKKCMRNVCGIQEERKCFTFFKWSECSILTF